MCVYAYIYVRIYVYMYRYIHIHIYIYFFFSLIILRVCLKNAAWIDVSGIDRRRYKYMGEILKAIEGMLVHNSSSYVILINSLGRSRRSFGRALCNSVISLYFSYADNLNA